MSTDATDGRPRPRPARRRSGSGTTSTPVSTPDRALLSAAQRVLADKFGSARGSAHWSEAADELASLTLALQAAAPDRKTWRETATEPGLRRTLLKLLENELVRSGQPTHGEEAMTEPGAGHPVSALDSLPQDRAPAGDTQIDDFLTGPDGGELMAEIAHDLRSPLTSILTLAEALRRGQSGDVNEVQRRQLGLIYNAALALSATASDLIELAHGGDRLAQAEPLPFSLTEILDSIRDMVYPMAEEKGLELKFQIGVADRRLGYPLALSRVLLNLTTNALKFTEDGFVEISAQPTGPIDVEISVRDTGRGIDPQALATLYQPFRPAPGRGGYCFSGTGLGLAISRRLIEAMGSPLELETRPGWGTRFYFQLALPPANSLS